MNKQQRMKDTLYYKYYNVNPFEKFGGDCVVRAIALMTNDSWAGTIHKLTDLGIQKGFVLNDKHVYIDYLKKKGFIEMNEPRDDYNRKMSLADFLDNNPNVTDFVAIVGSHHVTAVKNGRVHDIWNCSNETIHRYYVVPGK